MSMLKIFFDTATDKWKWEYKQKTPAFLLRFLLGYQGSNLDKQNQNLLCYRYTITQSQNTFCVWECKNRGFVKKPKLFFKLFLELGR